MKRYLLLALGAAALAGTGAVVGVNLRHGRWLAAPSAPRNPPDRDYPDVRFKDLSADAALDRTAIVAMYFNTATKWAPPIAAVGAAVLHGGMNPGLGIRSLHQQGITGKGVAVGIIDQNIFPDHPEYRDRLAQYRDVGCNARKASMHGPAVASLLVGETVGTAPGAVLYFAAAPSWKRDTKYFAEALDWLLQVNATLPAGARIRVISVSAAPSGPGSPFNARNEMWDAACARAQAAGVLVLDCTMHRGIVGPCYLDLDRPDELAAVTPGFPGRPIAPGRKVVLAPCSRRSQAEEYDQGVFGYQYTGRGGLSWSIPYAAGVLALGWQVRPELGSERLVELLFQTAYEKDGFKVINPVAFVAAVKNSS